MTSASDSRITAAVSTKSASVASRPPRAPGVQDIDLGAGLMRVERSWDPRVGPVTPKSRAGRRVVPIPTVLRALLAEHLLALGWHEGLAFGRAKDVPFNSEPVNTWAYKGWAKTGLPADHAPRVPAHVRLADDRRRRQRQGAQHVHGPLERDHHQEQGPLPPPGSLLLGSDHEAAQGQ